MCALLSHCGAGGNSDSLFDIEKAVGTIVIAKPLDAEQRSFYNLTVQATDGTTTAYTQVPQELYLQRCKVSSEQIGLSSQYYDNINSNW